MKSTQQTKNGLLLSIVKKKIFLIFLVIVYWAIIGLGLVVSTTVNLSILGIKKLILYRIEMSQKNQDENKASNGKVGHKDGDEKNEKI